MLQGICVDSGLTTTLAQGKAYYLFPRGTEHYLVSKFPNGNAHMGCYHAEHFKLVEKELWPEEPEIKAVNLNQNNLYRARLIWREKFYQEKPLKNYYLKPGKTHAFFYHDAQLEKFCGCFPLHWFSDFEEVEVVSDTEEIELEFTESDHVLLESVQKRHVCEQLSLF